MSNIAGTKTYADAIHELNSLQTGHKVLTRNRLDVSRRKLDKLDIMRGWVRSIGYSLEDLNKINVIHIAGSKGKTTTATMVASILNVHREKYGKPTKVGLFTSPHLISVRERIKINSRPIPEDIFTKYFYEVFNRLENAATRPNYFRMLTLVALHTFIQERVDAAVLEVGVGGEYDSTNVITRPVATGITSLEFDHTISLGLSIEEIAWHKAGIFKSGVKALSVPQPVAASDVLSQRAKEKSIKLEIVDIHPHTCEIGLSPPEKFQWQNASMAACLVLAYQGQSQETRLSDETVLGLKEARLPGKLQLLEHDNNLWCVDSAHTDESLKITAKYFSDLTDARSQPLVLLFNHQTQRDGAGLLEAFHSAYQQNAGPRFDHVIFPTSFTLRNGRFKPDFENRNADVEALKNRTLQKQYANTWKQLEPETSQIKTCASVEEALELIKEIGKGDSIRILVTGSTHLAGAVLSFFSQD